MVSWQVVGWTFLALCLPFVFSDWTLWFGSFCLIRIYMQCLGYCVFLRYRYPFIVFSLRNHVLICFTGFLLIFLQVLCLSTWLFHYYRFVFLLLLFSIHILCRGYCAFFCASVVFIFCTIDVPNLCLLQICFACVCLPFLAQLGSSYLFTFHSMMLFCFFD